MKQFYELYSDEEKVSTLLTQLSWSNHLKIMSGSKSKEEREFYINLAIKENLTHRELVRQIDIGYYECYMLSNFVLEKKEIKMRINDFHKTLELITKTRRFNRLVFYSVFNFSSIICPIRSTSLWLPRNSNSSNTGK